MLRIAGARCFSRASIRNFGFPSSIRCMSSYPDHEVVPLPALSPTMTHGNLASWKAKEGEFIAAGDIICEVETDKAVVEYEAQDDVYLAKILVPEGTADIAVGTPMMVTVEEQENVSAFADFKAPASPLPEEEEEALEAVSVPAPAPVAPVPTPAPAPAPTPAPALASAPAPGPAKGSSSVPMIQTPLISRSTPLNARLIQIQEQYLTQYGMTGTVPMTKA